MFRSLDGEEFYKGNLYGCDSFNGILGRVSGVKLVVKFVYDNENKGV